MRTNRGDNIFTPEEIEILKNSPIYWKYADIGYTTYSGHEIQEDINGLVTLDVENLILLRYLYEILRIKETGSIANVFLDKQLTNNFPECTDGLSGYFVDQQKIELQKGGDYYLSWRTADAVGSCTAGALSMVDLVTAVTGYRIQLGWIHVCQNGGATIDLGEPKEIMKCVIQDDTGTPIVFATLHCFPGIPHSFWCGNAGGVGKAVDAEWTNGGGTEEVSISLSYRYYKVV